MPNFFPGFERERVRVNGVELTVVHGRAGIPVLLLHGYPQMHLLWHKVAPRLAERYRVVAPAMRGYGDSEKPPAEPDEHAVYCKRTMAADLVELMGHFGHAASHGVGRRASGTPHGARSSGARKELHVARRRAREDREKDRA